MIENCLKCGHTNNASTGDDAEACPQCGAIYSKVEMAMAARQRPQEKVRSKQFWTYAILIAMLSVLLPLAAYEHTWGSSAKRRQSEASLKAVLATQRAVVFNSGVDGSVSQVERYLKRNLKDPASLDVIEWSSVAAGPDNGFRVRVKYRAKNSFGGYAIEQKVFGLNASGDVVAVVDAAHQ